MRRIVKKNSQAGAVLVISLIMLALLTIISVAAMQSTGMEEKMAGNMRDRNLAFQAAESALREGESMTETRPTVKCPGGAKTGYYLSVDFNCDGNDDSPAIIAWEAIDWSANNSIEYSGYTSTSETVARSDNLGTLSAKPRLILEQLPEVDNDPCATGSCEIGTPTPKGEIWYRITSRATGATPDAVVMLQSVYKR